MKLQWYARRTSDHDGRRPHPHPHSDNHPLSFFLDFISLFLTLSHTYTLIKPHKYPHVFVNQTCIQMAVSQKGLWFYLYPIWLDEQCHSWPIQFCTQQCQQMTPLRARRMTTGVQRVVDDLINSGDCTGFPHSNPPPTLTLSAFPTVLCVRH